MKLLLSTLILMGSFSSFAAERCSEAKAVTAAKSFLKKEFKTTGQFPLDGSTKVYVSNSAKNESTHFTVSFSVTTKFSNDLDVQFGTLAVDPNNCGVGYLNGERAEEISL